MPPGDPILYNVWCACYTIYNIGIEFEYNVDGFIKQGNYIARVGKSQIQGIKFIETYFIKGDFCVMNLWCAAENGVKK